MQRTFGQMNRHYAPGFGAAPPPAARPITATVTGQAAGLVNLAAKPVRWAFFTAGSLVNWAGGTLQAIGRKL